MVGGSLGAEPSEAASWMRSSSASISSSRTSGSSPEKGSSIRISEGRKASTLASAAFIRMPRESCFSLRSSGRSSCRISAASSHVG